MTIMMPKLRLRMTHQPFREKRRQANATPDNFGTETPRAEKLKPLSRPLDPKLRPKDPLQLEFSVLQTPPNSSPVVRGCVMCRPDIIAESSLPASWGL